MPFIELPRALEDYFAFAETEPTRRGRRFSITLPFHNGKKLERLQWWYHVSPAEEQMFEGHGLLVLRVRAVQRFCRHIERWLQINRLLLEGDEPIPRLSSQAHSPVQSSQQHVEIGKRPAVISPRQTREAPVESLLHADARSDERRPAAHIEPELPRKVIVTADSDQGIAELPAWPLIQAVSA
jgi:hypothetical protein